MNMQSKLESMGLILPEPPQKGGIYIPAKRVDNLLYLSGVGPIIHGAPQFKGKVGDNLTIEQGREAARTVALNMLSIINHMLGDLDHVVGIFKILGFVASANDFTRQPEVINAASQIFVDLFGEDGQHARSAIGVNVLPGDIPVEIEGLFLVR